MSPRDDARGQPRTVKVARPFPRSPVPAYEDRQAEVFGPLAVLPEPPERAARGEPHGWALLHIGTGRALGPTLPDRPTALEALRLLANEDWAFAHPAYAAPSLAGKVRSVMREVLRELPHPQPSKEQPGDTEPDRPEALRPGWAA